MRKNFKIVQKYGRHSFGQKFRNEMWAISKINNGSLFSQSCARNPRITSSGPSANFRRWMERMKRYITV